jgi:DNA polymerase-3 subunit epsilon
MQGACTVRRRLRRPAGAASGPEHRSDGGGDCVGSLTDDPEFLATTFVVIDFETTTPTGYPAQPIEVAVLALRYQHGGWQRVGNSTSLIKPPPFAPVTPADTAQTGLTAAMFDDAREPAFVLGALDQRFTAARSYLFVAQHAVTEGNVVHNQRRFCPHMSRIDYVDTVLLAKRIIAGLPNYQLDTLLGHFSIKRPEDRHRAYADVEVTAELFIHLVSSADRLPDFKNLAALTKMAGRTARSNIPIQANLF